VVLIEKILGPGERLPGAWATDGTTGYEFADWAGSLLVDPTGLDLLAAGSAELAGGTPFFAELALEAKREVLATLFPGQVRRLARLARTLAELDGHLDLAEARFAAAIAELVANLDVYRIYADEEGASAEDRGRLERASELAGPHSMPRSGAPPGRSSGGSWAGRSQKCSGAGHSSSCAAASRS